MIQKFIHFIPAISHHSLIPSPFQAGQNSSALMRANMLLATGASSLKLWGNNFLRKNFTNSLFAMLQNLTSSTRLGVHPPPHILQVIEEIKDAGVECF
jgi:hypothetical protein